MDYIIIVLIFITIFIIFINNDIKEHHNGALIQLVAKGPQDTYLTDDAWKYIPSWFYNYPNFIFYNRHYPYYF